MESSGFAIKVLLRLSLAVVLRGRQRITNEDFLRPKTLNVDALIMCLLGFETSFDKKGNPLLNNFHEAGLAFGAPRIPVVK